MLRSLLFLLLLVLSSTFASRDIFCRFYVKNDSKGLRYRNYSVQRMGKDKLGAITLSTPQEEFPFPVIIEINKESLLFGKVNKGDGILSINNVLSNSLSFAEVNSLISSSPLLLNMCGFSPPIDQVDGDYIYNVTLSRQVKGFAAPPWGLQIGKSASGVLIIVRAAQGGVAYAHGSIIDGDQIIGVNGRSIANLSLDDLSSLLARTDSTLVLALRENKKKSTPPPIASQSNNAKQKAIEEEEEEKSSSDYSFHKVKIKKIKGSVGMRLEVVGENVVIQSLVANGAGSESGLLSVGDALIEIDEVNIGKMHSQSQHRDEKQALLTTTANLLLKSGDLVQLMVMRETEASKKKKERRKKEKEDANHVVDIKVKKEQNNLPNHVYRIIDNPRRIKDIQFSLEKVIGVDCMLVTFVPQYEKTIEVGDYLLSVASQSTKHMIPQDIKIIAAQYSVFELLFIKKDEIIYTKLFNPLTQSLGLKLAVRQRSFITIESLPKGGFAHMSGLFNIGDSLIEISELEMDGATLEPVKLHNLIDVGLDSFVDKMQKIKSRNISKAKLTLMRFVDVSNIVISSSNLESKTQEAIKKKSNDLKQQQEQFQQKKDQDAFVCTLVEGEKDISDFFRIKKPACMGAQFAISKSVSKAQVILAEPFDACVPLKAESCKGKIVVAQRGKCYFHLKALNAQMAGASALIIINSNDDVLFKMGIPEHLINSASIVVKIPVVLMKDSVGKFITKALKSPLSMSITTVDPPKNFSKYIKKEKEAKKALDSQSFVLHDDFAGGLFDFSSGKIGLNFQGPSPLKINHNIALRSVLTGEKAKLSIRKPILCKHCHGKGALQHTQCPLCVNDVGLNHHDSHLGHTYFQRISQTCPVCLGYGEIADVGHICKVCQGNKFTLNETEITVDIPKGAPEGHKVVFAGDGYQSVNHPPSDLVVVVNSNPHPTFTREKENLLYRIEINLEEALLGFATNITLLNGTLFEYKREGITKNGFEDSISGLGLPFFYQDDDDNDGEEGEERGDLKITIMVKLPSLLGNAKKDKLKEGFPDIN